MNAVRNRASVTLSKVLFAFVIAGVSLETGRCEQNAGDAEPNPRELLKAVAQARTKINSGHVEFDVSQYYSGRPLDGTNHFKIDVVFEGNKRRVEVFGREYSYTLMGPKAAEVTDRKREELALGREAAVAQGLLESHQTHDISIFDGITVMSFSSKEGQRRNATVGDSPRGGSLYAIDPRTLGLTPSPSFSDTIESCLEHSRAESVRLLGKEMIGGIPTWHVRVSYPQSWPIYDYWINTTNTAQLVKQGFNGNTVTAEFNGADDNDPLPTVVRPTNFFSKERVRVDTEFLRRAGRFNVPVDSTSWTLEGLKMPIGTEVVDSRTGRTLGYWYRSGLSNKPPAELAEIESATAPNVAALLDLAQKDPKSLFAAHAYFTAATVLKRYAIAACSERATTEAEGLFAKLLEDHGELPWEGMILAEQVRPELSELRRVGVGKIAPEIEGDEVDGRKMKLSEYRGKVVVLSFWGSWCPPCMARIPEENKLAERMANERFALIGVNSDDDFQKAQGAIARMKIRWPSFRDGKQGPIARGWHVRIWPSNFVLDARGVIRFRNRWGKDLDVAIDELIAELREQSRSASKNPR